MGRLKYHKRTLIVLQISLTTYLLAIIGEPQPTNASQTVSDASKLDRLIGQVELLTERQEELTRLLVDRCGCSCTEVRHLSENVKQSSSSLAAAANAEQRGDPLLHFNKLAADFNLIPFSSDPLNARKIATVSATKTAPTEDQSDVSADRLVVLVRDQIAGFRVSLNKLMGKLMDQIYLYNVLANQLALVRDECSPSAVGQSSAGASPTASAREGNDKWTSQDNAQSSAAFRLSDMTTIARLVAVELKSTSSDMSIGEHDRRLTTGELSQCAEWATNGTFHQLTKRLDGLDSVVKHSALMLSKLTQTRESLVNPAKPNQREYSAESRQQVTLTFSNRDSQSEEPTRLNQTSSRWFSGSKVPGRRVGADGDEMSGQRRQQPDQKTDKCISKVPLVRPTSCRQLRLAGANCTGQYYVFVNGSIRYVYCDMNMDSEDDGGGWTVILRRIDKSLGTASVVVETLAPTKTSANRQVNQWLELFKVSQLNFELDWFIYRQGFGQLNEWAEFFVGLDLLHQMTTSEVHELQLDIVSSESNQLRLRFDDFRVENEQNLFRVHLGACNATDSKLCSPLTRINGSQFRARDPPTDLNTTTTVSHNPPTNLTHCPLITTGWWIASQSDEPQECPLALTHPIGRTANGNLSHLYWPHWSHSLEPIQRLVLKIRRKRLPQTDQSLKSA